MSIKKTENQKKKAIPMAYGIYKNEIKWKT
jgi:hypothetical protein